MCSPDGDTGADGDIGADGDTGDVTGATGEDQGREERRRIGPPVRRDVEPTDSHEVGAGIELEHLPRDVRPALSAQDAIRAFEASWGILWRRYGDPDPELMVGRNERGAYWEPAKGETFASSFSDRLVWVLTWRQIPARDAAERATPGEQVGAPPHDAAYVRIGIVDAMTGDVLAVIEEFNPDLRM
jgi:hypothetical protein